jgi:hypothetical protein
MAYDQERDTLWISPDLDLSVFEFGLGDKDPLGALLSTVSPENGQGDRDGKVSGVVVGKGDTLYVGRGFDSEIRKVDKNTGTFVSDFTRTSSADGGHVEDLTCDPLTYAPREAILAKHNTGEFYEAFEVEEGTCPLRPRTFGGEASPLLACFFECKPRSPLTWQGITTLVLVSLERSTPANTNVSVVIRGGISGQGAIAALRFPSTSVINSFTVESHDVDEISICGSLEEAGVRVPEIGLVEIIQRNPVTFGTPPRRIYGWVKNLLGTFRMDVNEPFSRRNIARGIAKTECRVVPTTLEELEDRVDAADLVQPISPIFIEETLDLPPLGSP